MPNKVCSDKAPLKNREWSVTKCYKKELKAGYRAGIDKGEKIEKDKAIIRAKIVKNVKDTAFQRKMEKAKTISKSYLLENFDKFSVGFLKELAFYYGNNRNSYNQTIQRLERYLTETDWTRANIKDVSLKDDEKRRLRLARMGIDIVIGRLPY